MDRRGLFFLGSAAVSIALAPATDPKHRWVPEWLAVLYVILAILSFLDYWSRHHVRSETRAPGTAAEREGEDLTRTGR
ncbi:MAG TPA: hypothetical protein VFW74_04165 [Acidimicrobiia bacterium]|nr:hypothetical protein [Acidimicrobiia bacterium]